MTSGILGSSPQKPCERCGELFRYKPSIERRGHARFCSRLCQNRWIGDKRKGVKRVLPESWYEKMRLYNFSRRGNPSPKRGKKYPHLQGKNSSRWMGGKSSPNELERVRFRRLMQSKIFTRDNYTCQICDIYGVPIQVDHIKSWSKYPELRFEPSNCRTLCMPCHYYVTFKRKMPNGIIWGHNLSRRIGK